MCCNHRHSPHNNLHCVYRVNGKKTGLAFDCVLSFQIQFTICIFRYWKVNVNYILGSCNMSALCDFRDKKHYDGIIHEGMQNTSGHFIVVCSSKVKFYTQCHNGSAFPLSYVIRYYTFHLVSLYTGQLTRMEPAEYILQEMGVSKTESLQPRLPNQSKFQKRTIKG